MLESRLKVTVAKYRSDMALSHVLHLNIKYYEAAK